MKFSYKFARLLGTVYRKGNLLFTPDGNVVVSPVGNKITLFDLKNNKSETLPIESRYNFTRVAIAPHGYTLIAITEEGEALLISLISQTILHTYRVNKKVRDVKFSPDGKHYAITKDNVVFLFKTPGPHTREFNPFIMERVFKGAFDDTVCLDWTSDSRVLAVGSKDMSTRLYAVENFANLKVYSLGGHSDSVVGCFFENDSLDLYTVSRSGQVCVWNCNTNLDGLIPAKKEEEKRAKKDSDDEEDVVEETIVETITATSDNKDSKIRYSKLARHYLSDLVRGQGSNLRVTAVDYHKKTKVLVSGYSNGAFFLHEMPHFTLIHSLSIAEQHISTITTNNTGDWIAIGCESSGNLLVWEWQSESYIMKQQGHFHSMNCLTYSPDGQYLATGGDDSKVKLWNTSSGFCFVTFAEHQATVTGLAFSQNGKVIVSSSLDGTVRAFDLHRYRNFRTFTSPRPTQYSCLTLDSSGEFVCAGAQDSFEIFIWSMQNGKLLEILSGHTGPVSSLSFSSTQTVLASGSWDGTVRFWDVFESKENKEIITLSTDVVSVVYRPDGHQIAVATLDAQISFFDIPSLLQTGSIEGRNDLASGRRDTDLVTPKTANKGKAFTTLCYSADGEYILAGGQSKNVCIYNISQQILIKKFEITQNRSLDGLDDMISRRKMTEFGNLALVEERNDDESPVQISLPGVKNGDLSSRSFKPEVRVSGIIFSPTGRCWAATTTEGLLIYSLDHVNLFDPFELEIGITSTSVKEKLQSKDFTLSLMQALKLNEKELITLVLEKIPVSDVDLISQSLPIKYVERLLGFLGCQLEISRHLEFYLIWIQSLLMAHGQLLKSKSMSLMATLHLLQKNLTVRSNDLRAICEHNKYSVAYILQLGKIRRKNEEKNTNSDTDDDDDHCIDSTIMAME